MAILENKLTFEPTGYSPECVEKLFGKSDWLPNRSSEDLQERPEEP